MSGGRVDRGVARSSNGGEPAARARFQPFDSIEEDTMANTSSTHICAGIDAPTTTSTRTWVARHAATITSVVLGLILFVFGLNGFLNFIPPPTEPMPEGAVRLGASLMNSGYLLQFIKGTEVL